MVARALVVEVIAVHVTCSLCGDTARIDMSTNDEFTTKVLTPFGTWWHAHRAPHLAGWDMLIDGHLIEWAGDDGVHH